MSADFAIVKRKSDGGVGIYVSSSGGDTPIEFAEIQFHDEVIGLLVDAVEEASNRRDEAWQRFEANRETHVEGSER